MNGIIAWLILGLIAGALAKMFYPGYQGGSIFSTLGLGILGAVIGGYLGQVLLGSSAAAAASAGSLSLGSIFFAVLGAMLLLYLWSLIARRAL